MFFTKLGSFLSWAIFVFGAFQFLSGWLVATDILHIPHPEVQAAIWFGATTPGFAIDKGFEIILLATGLGILCEISRKVAAGSE